MFAHKYFSISRQTPFKLANKEVPRRMIICDKITNWVFLFLNCITPIFTAVAAIGIEINFYKYYFLGKDTEKMRYLLNLYSEMTVILYSITLLLPIISGFLLFCALCKIYNSLKKN